jgi:hypothetical protein
MFDWTRSVVRRLKGEPVAAVPVGAERRNWGRVPGSEAFVQIELDDAPPIMGTVQDVSRAGLRLLLDREVDEGGMVRINLEPAKGDKGTQVLACVVHVQALADTAFVVGCNFSTELNDEDLAALGARRTKTREGDPRAWARVPAAGRAVWRSPNHDGAEHSAAIQNISPGGLALKVKEELQPGTLLELELRDWQDRPVKTMLACVVYQMSLEAGQWLSGCTFVRELTEQDLAAFIGPQA